MAVTTAPTFGGETPPASRAPLLALVALVTRLPLQSHLLYHWDSVNFAFALRHLDVAHGQPQAPGYLLYVIAGRAASALAGGAQAGLTMLSVFGSAASAWALYDLGRRLWDSRVGLLAALALLSSPVFWFYGEVALPHTLDMALVLVTVTLCWRVWQGEDRLAAWLAFWLGIAGGFRPQTLLFLLPLAIAACRRLPCRQVLAAGAVLCAAVMAWLLPLLALSGGASRYVQVVSAYSAVFDRPTSVFLGAGWAGLHHNLSKLVRYTLWAWGFSLILAAFGAPRSDRTDRAPARRRLMILWALPPLLFYSLVHMGQQGLIFVYLPVCLLWSARGGAALMERRSWGSVFAALCFAGNALLYLCAPASPLGGRVKVLSQATIREHDGLLQAQMAALRAGLPPRSLLLAENWRFPQYYLPGVALRPAGPTAGEEETGAGAPLATSLARAATLAWYEPALDPWNKSADRTILGPIRRGVRLRLLRRTGGETFWLTSAGFGVRRLEPSVKTGSAAGR